MWPPDAHASLISLDFEYVKNLYFLDYWDEYLSESKRHGLIANNGKRTTNQSTMSTSDFRDSF